MNQEDNKPDRQELAIQSNSGEKDEGQSKQGIDRASAGIPEVSSSSGISARESSASQSSDHEPGPAQTVDQSQKLPENANQPGESVVGLSAVLALPESERKQGKVEKSCRQGSPEPIEGAPKEPVRVQTPGCSTDPNSTVSGDSLELPPEPQKEELPSEDKPGVAHPDLKSGIIKKEDNAPEPTPGGTSYQQSSQGLGRVGESATPGADDRSASTGVIPVVPQQCAMDNQPGNFEDDQGKSVTSDLVAVIGSGVSPGPANEAGGSQAPHHHRPDTADPNVERGTTDEGSNSPRGGTLSGLNGESPSVDAKRGSEPTAAANRTPELSPGGPSDQQSSPGVVTSVPPQLGPAEQAGQPEQTSTSDPAHRVWATVSNVREMGNENAANRSGGDDSVFGLPPTTAERRQVASGQLTVSVDVKIPNGKPLPCSDSGPKPVAQAGGEKRVPKRSCIPGVELPQKLEEYLIQLSNRFEVSPLAVLLVTLIIIAAALGGGVVLVTTLWPSPITGSLDCALWDDRGRIRPVLDALAQPLRDAQDQRLSKLGDAGAKGIDQQIRDLEDQRESYFMSDLVRDLTVESRFNAKITALRALLRPGLILENPAVGSLYQAVARGGGALAIYDDPTVKGLLDAPKNGGEDFQFLSRAAQGKTPESSFLQGTRDRPLVRPPFSGVLICVKNTLTGLLCSGAPKIVDFRKQLLLSRVVRRQGRTGTDSGAGLSALRSWASWIAGWVAGQNGEPRRLSLSRGAFVLLSDFARKLDRAPAGQMGLAQWGPILAAKISLLLHVFSADPGNEIPEATMRTAIALTECLTGESASTARGCMGEQEGSDLEDQLDRMEEKIKKREPVRWRKLRRTYPDKDPAPLLAIFEELVHRGRARRRKDGRIETVPPTAEPPTT